jgi:hypothetical protein
VQHAHHALDADRTTQRVRFRVTRDGQLLAAGELAFAPP